MEQRYDKHGDLTEQRMKSMKYDDLNCREFGFDKV